jgi:hypothetical protein
LYFEIFQIIGMLRVVASRHRERSPEALQQRAWYKIRDTLFGHNYVERDVKKALELAAVCEHPDAVWLTKLFAGRDVSTTEEARQVFLSCENDPKALGSAGLLSHNLDEIVRAADLGDSFVRTWLTWRSIVGERYKVAENSAAQGERDGFYYLGHCFQGGYGCAIDLERAKENYLIAAELGSVSAMAYMGILLERNDIQRLVWLGRAAVGGESRKFLHDMIELICKFNSGQENANVVFVIGRALMGQINNDKGTIFGSDREFNICIGPANQALHFYEFQSQCYRKAVDAWTLIGLRFSVVKDVRRMIGEMIWDFRKRAEYKLE